MVRFPEDIRASLAGYGRAEEGGALVDALPHEGYDIASYEVCSVEATGTVCEGDMIDLGDRHFSVFHLPGRSLGSIGLFEAATKTLFSGDAVYDGPLRDELPGSDIAAYRRTIKRLRDMEVATVHGGHDPAIQVFAVKSEIKDVYGPTKSDHDDAGVGPFLGR
jgi:glyoxylase-like metal-dependent hydrolase (beta-lactamase superfamily II)